MDGRDDRCRFDGGADHDATRQIVGLVRLLVHAIDRGPGDFSDATLADFLHDSDDRVPVAFLIEALESESLSEWRAPRVIAIRKRFVDYDHGRLGSSIRSFKEPAFAQSRADRRKVAMSHHAG